MARIIGILSIFLLFPKLGVASYIPKVGDVLLQDLDCWSCYLIEEQENSNYSHMGMIVEDNGELKVLEALGDVHLIHLTEFLARRKDKGSVKVLRPYQLSSSSRLKLKNILKNYIGLAYDREFLWDNKESGSEKYYCSELVYKILNSISVDMDFYPKIMNYDINPEAWDVYFNDKTPRGLLGVSPEDFHLSSSFYPVQEI